MNYPRACLRPAESNSMLEPGVSTGVHSEARRAHQPPWGADPSPLPRELMKAMMKTMAMSEMPE